MTKTIQAGLLALILISCGKPTAPNITPEKAASVNPVQNSDRINLPHGSKVQLHKQPVFSTSEAKEAQKPNSPDIPDEKLTNTPAKTSLALEPELESAVNETITENLPGVKTDTLNLSSERPDKVIQVESAAFPDFDWEKYMVLPGDFLIKIAKNEYGDFRMWRKIYEWNREIIGNNPHMIYPYHFLNLMKEREKVVKKDPVYFTYNVQPGDNLWTIAGNQYGDAKSWIILLWDNEELLQSSNGILSPGMTLKLREKLDPTA